MKSHRPEFSVSEIVRVISQAPDRASLAGKLGTVIFVDRKDAERKFLVDVYGSRRPFVLRTFSAVELESTGQQDAFYTNERPEVAGRREARRAIVRRQLYLCEAGGLMAHALPGINAEEEQRLAGLPRRSLAAGCTDPKLFRAIAFSRAFNQTIVAFLSKQKMAADRKTRGRERIVRRRSRT